MQNRHASSGAGLGQGAQKSLIDVEAVSGQYEKRLINRVRVEVGHWRRDGYPNTTRITRELLRFWFEDSERIDQRPVLSYVKNAFLGFTIPHIKEGKKDSLYSPDFIVRCKTSTTAGTSGPISRSRTTSGISRISLWRRSRAWRRAHC